MSLDDLLEWEGLGEDRLQAAISQAVGDETFTALQPRRVAGRVERDLRQPKAAQHDGLSDQLQGGHSRRLRTQGPVDEDDGAGHRRPHELLHGRAAHGVEHDPGALATGQAEDFLTRSCSSVATTWVAPASIRACLFELLRVRAMGVAPTRLAIWMAARPTPLEAAGTTSASPAFRSAMSIRAP